MSYDRRTGLTLTGSTIHKHYWKSVVFDIRLRSNCSLNPDGEEPSGRQTEWETDDAHLICGAATNRRPGIPRIIWVQLDATQLRQRQCDHVHRARMDSVLVPQAGAVRVV